jgi:cell division protein FtsL
MIRRKWSPREIVLGVGFLVALVGLLTFYIWYQSEAVRLGLEIAKCKAEIDGLKDDIQKLELRRTALLSPERVEQIARERLGLVSPKTEDIIYGSGGASH